MPKQVAFFHQVVYEPPWSAQNGLQVKKKKARTQNVQSQTYRNSKRDVIISFKAQTPRMQSAAHTHAHRPLPHNRFVVGKSVGLLVTLYQWFALAERLFETPTISLSSYC
jgi:hypothetical protein